MGHAPALPLDQLRDDLGYRRIEQGVRRLGGLRSTLEAIRPGSPGAGVWVGLLAQWMDAGFDGQDLLRELVARFPTAARSSLPILDYLHLRMAEGILAMYREDLERALLHFRFVQALEAEVEDAQLFAAANFWTARCLHRMGRYDDAAAYLERGEELALSRGYCQLAAIMQTARSWIAFQKGKLSEAGALLRRAEEALAQTDDFHARCNIQSAHGRIARSHGKFQRAIDCFERALEEYRSGGRSRLQLARTLSNLAFAKRELALELQHELDRAAAASRRSARETAGPEQARDLRGRIGQLRSEAAQHLDESMAIYSTHDNHHGMAGVNINRGFLHLDAGDLENAAIEAAEAFRLGDEKRDYIALARARTLQCVIELEAIDEQLGDSAAHYEAAEAFSREALQFAGRTQNRRLLARAHVWRGLALSVTPHGDPDAARQSCEQALALLVTDGSELQPVWEDLSRLESRVLRAKPVDATLRAWSAGVTTGQSFQQLTEEFARIVIPKVWEREGRKVSRVARKLAISPKKVRRILHSAGFRPPAERGG